MTGKLRLIIRQKIVAGLLPGDPPITVWAGVGTGGSCGACDEPIAGGDTEIELEMPASRPGVRLHRQCYTIWREECGHR